MNEERKRFVLGAVMIFIVLAITMGACQATTPDQSSGLPNQSFMHVIARQLSVNGPASLNGPALVAGPTAIGTATPALLIQSAGVSVPFEIRNSSGTPVAVCGADGACVFAGTLTSAGAVNGGGVLGAALHIAPTTVATNTPAFRVNSATGNTANLFEGAIALTPVYSVGASGSVVNTGSTSSGGVTINAWGKVAAATAIATATPAFVVDSLGVSTILEVRDAATPVFYVANGGGVTAVGAITAAGAINAAGTISSTTRLQTTFIDGASGAGKTAVANATPIVPTSSTMLLTAAGAVDPGGVGAGTVGGQILILVQTSAQAITMTEAGTLHLGAATRVINQYDTLTLIWDGAAWCELAYTDN